jgi:hypothetical protein
VVFFQLLGVMFSTQKPSLCRWLVAFKGAAIRAKQKHKPPTQTNAGSALEMPPVSSWSWSIPNNQGRNLADRAFAEPAATPAAASGALARARCRTRNFTALYNDRFLPCTLTEHPLLV